MFTIAPLGAHYRSILETGAEDTRKPPPRQDLLCDRDQRTNGDRGQREDVRQNRNNRRHNCGSGRQHGKESDCLRSSFEPIAAFRGFIPNDDVAKNSATLS